MKDLMRLPPDLPVPIDDGACDHLTGMFVPSIRLRTTEGREIDLRAEAAMPTVIFVYPRTGDPLKPTPPSWEAIPGARGCTPQSCGFRDRYDEFRSLGFRVFGASSQTTEYQREFVSRNHIPFEILSDDQFRMTTALRLPTFEYDGARLIKRLALVMDEGRIVGVFYPVFPPNENAATVLAWIRAGKAPRKKAPGNGTKGN